MQPNNLSVVLLFLIARIWAAGIIHKSESNSSLDIDKAAINVITSCYKDRGYTIGIVGANSDFLVKTLSFQGFPVVLMHNSTYKMSQSFYEYQRTNSLYKLKVFVITVQSSDGFYKVTSAVFYSVWWNNMASFLLLYKSSQGCEGADYLFMIGWSRSLINAKVICFDFRYGMRVHGFNPFMTQAPVPWRIKNIYTVAIDDVTSDFTVFERPYTVGNEMCKNLDIDKIKNLNGYPVEIMFPTWSYTNTNAGINNYNHGGIVYNVIVSGIRAMNGTVIEKKVIYSNDSASIHSFRDVLFASAPLSSAAESAASSPFADFDLVVVTHHRGYKSQLQKIFSIVDTYSNIAVCAALVTILVFFKFFALQTLMPATLNVIRIVCNTGFTNIPENSPSKIFLTGILIFAVTMQGIYQGNLASLLTNQMSFPNVNTRQDLIDSDHTIYVQRGWEMFFSEPILQRRLVITEGKRSCIDYVLHNASAACILPSSYAMDSPEVVYVSDRVESTLAVLGLRTNWPLKTQFDIVIDRLFEGDLVLPYKLRTNQTTLEDFRLNRELKDFRVFRNMTLTDLSFAFVILGVGLALAVITFVFEIAIRSLGSGNRKQSVMVRPFVGP